MWREKVVLCMEIQEGSLPATCTNTNKHSSLVNRVSALIGLKDAINWMLDGFMASFRLNNITIYRSLCSFLVLGGMLNTLFYCFEKFLNPLCQYYWNHLTCNVWLEVTRWPLEYPLLENLYFANWYLNLF